MAGLTFRKRQASSEEWEPIRKHVIARLVEDRRDRAAEILRTVTFDIFRISSAYDASSALYGLLSPRQFDALALTLPADAAEYKSIAAAVTRFSSYYIDYIVADVTFEQTYAASSLKNLPPPNVSTPTPVPDRFDVAISFAGTERAIAEHLANALKARGVSVFYDSFYVGHLWGKDLAILFDDIFRKRARYCIVLLSKEYVRRAWTRHELRSALARGIADVDAGYLLPVQIEEVDLPGLAPTIGYVSFLKFGVAGVADLIVKKLDG